VIEVGRERVELLDQPASPPLKSIRLGPGLAVVADADIGAVTLIGQGGATEGSLELHAVMALCEAVIMTPAMAR
jgi:hypothetical protein